MPPFIQMRTRLLGDLLAFTGNLKCRGERSLDIYFSLEPCISSAMDLCWRLQRSSPPTREMQQASETNLADRKDFHKCPEECNLLDMGYQGYEFMWCNNREHPDTITSRARLDRACSSSRWASLFPLATVSHLLVKSSDHLAQHEEERNSDLRLTGHVLLVRAGYIAILAG